MNNGYKIMNNKNTKEFLYNQTPLKILSFISIGAGRLFSAREICFETKSSKGSVNQTLRILTELDILFREKKGNVLLYKLNNDNFVLKQFKIFENLFSLQQLIKEIKLYCYQIVLFGSCAEGLNSGESDCDLFIKTNYKNIVKGIINKYDTDFKIQSIIQNPLEIASARKKDAVFFEQVRKGITLWEGRPAYEEI